MCRVNASHQQVSSASLQLKWHLIGDSDSTLMQLYHLNAESGYRHRDNKVNSVFPAESLQVASLDGSIAVIFV